MSLTLFKSMKPLKKFGISGICLIGSLLLLSPSLAAEGVGSAYRDALAAAVKDDTILQQWYHDTGAASLWVGPEDARRREAFFAALSGVADHGLPVARYGAAELKASFAKAYSEGDLARIEAEMSRAFLRYAKDISSGMLEPRKIDETIVRDIAIVPPDLLLERIALEDPAGVLQDLLPKSAIYARLMHEKLKLESLLGKDAWGAPVPQVTLKPGQSGEAVVALRDRLVAMDYMARSLSRDYDADLKAAVERFQAAHGLPVDCVAGKETLAQINASPEERLRSVIVAMERERWMEIDRSGRLIWVNLPDFTAKIVDDGKTTFSTRAVIGREDMARRTPEFSDSMSYMVVNPSWGVPRSITVGEYLPLLQRNRNAVGHIDVVDNRGRVIPRSKINFGAYNARNFPYSMRQPPGDSNALGKVKFMFPNQYNIYLHDTPSKSLFANDLRAYSHGCIRLAEPFDFAHALFMLQSPQIEQEFQRTLKTGKETTVKLEENVPIHLVYYTAYPEENGKMGYRRDIYGRDGRLWAALEKAGVVIGPLSH